MLTTLMPFVQALVGRLHLRSETGQALVEYGILVGLIAVVCVATIVTLGTKIESYFTSIVSAL
jgi:pilus assembly protein Flp/PilA